MVRRAEPGEELETLDGSKRQLDSEMLLICDAERGVAIAGIMGGGNSEVSEISNDILLESACFNPVSIRRTSRRLNLATDSSYRFERGVDPQGTVRALERAARLIVELAGGELVPGGVDYRDGLKITAPIELRVQRCNDLLGISLTGAAISERLEAIEISSRPLSEQSLAVTVPGFRVDLEREVDLIEEVARLVGYNELPTTMPLVPLSFAENDPSRQLRARVAELLIGQGFSEAINYSFVSPQHFEQLGLAADDPARQVVRLLNPLSDEQSAMRTMLLPGILENARRNINHQVVDLRLFETGKVFRPSGGELPDEENRLVVVLSGRRYPGSPVYHFGQDEVDFFDIKGVAEVLLRELRCAGVKMVAETNPPRYVVQDNYLSLRGPDGIEVGGLGRLRQDCLRAFGIKVPIFFLEMNLAVVERLPVRAKRFTPLAKFPAVRWDLAVVVPETVASGELLDAIRSSGEALIEDVELFDVYQGEKIASGAKSVAISITYRDQEKTLADEAVQVVHQKIIHMIGTRFGGLLREI